MEILRATLALLIGSLVVGCAHDAPITPSAPENSAVVALPLDRVWARTMRVLAAQKPRVVAADHKHFLIMTEKTPVRLDETQADCGTHKGASYLTDSRTVTEVAYSVSLRGDGSGTRILVKAEIGGHFQGTATYDTATELSCVSLGALERNLIAKIRQEPLPAFQADFP